jgi:hypothetical protein
MAMNIRSDIIRACPYLSFCTTCMGRLEHLKRTMPANLDASEAKDIEFVLLNYSSQDLCEDWVRQTFQREIATGLVVYYRYDGATQFHHAHAKNLAHRLARGQIVCNVDADNYIGRGFADYIMRSFSDHPGSFIRAKLGQVFGRLAFLKADFTRLGGYDERMTHGWGAEDCDLIERAKATGLRGLCIDSDEFLQYISHDDDERGKLCKCRNIFQSHQMHIQMSTNSLARGKLVANEGLPWGCGKVMKNFEQGLGVCSSGISW